MGKKVVKTLYFINGVAPSDEQQAEIEAMPGNICVRNAIKLRDDENLEDFDYVAGEVPPLYAAQAARKTADGGDPVPAPKASASAPAAPQAATAKPSGKAGSAWTPN